MAGPGLVERYLLPPLNKIDQNVFKFIFFIQIYIFFLPGEEEVAAQDAAGVVAY